MTVYLQGFSSTLVSRALAGLSAEPSPPALALVSEARWRRPAAACSSAAARRFLQGHRLSPAAARPHSSVPPPDWQTARPAASPADLQLPAESWWLSGVLAAWSLMARWADFRLDGRIRKRLIFWLSGNTDRKGFVTIIEMHQEKMTCYNIWSHNFAVLKHLNILGLNAKVKTLNFLQLLNIKLD